MEQLFQNLSLDDNYIKLCKLYIVDHYKPLVKAEIELNNYHLSKIFEYYTCIKLYEEYGEIFYEYGDIPLDFKEEHRLSKNDTGIDCCNLVNTIVQCKLRSGNLKWGDCGTFFASQNVYCEITKQAVIKWPKLIIARNFDSTLSENLEFQKSRFVDKVYCKNKLIVYCNDLLSNPPVITYANTNIILRDYQLEAINLIRDNDQNVTICLPTGTGKNLVICHSMNKDHKYLILVPRIILMEQLKDVMLTNFPQLKNQIQCIGDNTRTYKDNKLITICVYNSISIILDDINSFNKIYIDEAHHIYTPEIYQDDESEVSDEDNTYLDKIKNLSSLNKIVYLSATIDENGIYYKKDIRDMISLGYLCDYNINIPIFNDNPSNLNVAEYIIKNHRNIIIYCNSQKEGKEFDKLLNSLLPNSSEYIDCKTSKKKRNEAIAKFKNSEITYLVNVRILIEGFDAPITKGVLFLHLPSNSTTIIQIIGRCLRLHESKNIANVILPYSTNEDGNSISKFLRILSENDSRIKKSYISKNTCGYISLEQIYKDEEQNDEEENTNVEFKYNLIYNNLGIQTNRIEIWKTRYEQALNYIELNNKRPSPRNKIISAKRIAIWICTQVKNYNNKENIMQNEEIRNIWLNFVTKYKKHFLSDEEKWYSYLNSVVKYIIQNNQRPSQSDKNPEIRKLADWLIRQSQNYKNMRKCMKIDKIRTDWIKFTNQYEKYLLTDNDKWFINLNNLKKYLDKNLKRPTLTNKDKEIKYLAVWLSNNTKNFKNKTKNIQNEKIIDAWNVFTKDYQQYFTTPEEKWYNSLNQVKNYITLYNKRPSQSNKNEEIKKLGKWLSHQHENYKHKMRIMKDNNNVYNEWTNFINEFPQYFN